MQDLNKGNYLSVQRNFTATDLGLNNAAYTASGSTAWSPVIPFQGVYAATFIAMSTTGAGKLQARVIDFDGATVIATYDLATAIAAGVPCIYHIALDLASSAVGGTVATSLYLPQYGLQFGFTNTNALAGTFTGKLIQAVY